MSSSSFLAIQCLREAGFQMQRTHPKASNAVLRNFYADYLLTGAHTTENLQQLKQDIIDILASAKFELRKWK